MKQKFVNISSYNTQHFKVPEHKLAFYELNENAKTTVVCIHSLVANSHDFDYLGDKLGEDFRVIAIDMPGRGSSDWFDNKMLYNYEVYVADLLALLRVLDISKMHFIGASMGGIMGMMLASTNPEMLHSLVLNDIGPEIPGKSLAKIRRYVGTNPNFPDFDSAKKYLQMIFRNFGISEDVHWDHVTRYNATLCNDGLYRLNYDPGIAEAFIIDMINPQDVVFWDIWDKITCPTLLIHGIDSDILLQKTVDKMNLRHNMSVYAMHDVGHPPALFNLDEINYINSWLKNITQNY